MKKIISLMLALILSLTFSMSALADSGSGGLDYVTDDAGILTESEREELNAYAREISENYECNVYIVTVDNYQHYNHESAYEAAKTIYLDYDLGYGEEKSGELLLLSMSNRKFTLIAYGYGNIVFTDYGNKVLQDAFLDDFANDDWYGGFRDYIIQSESMLEMAQEGEPLDVPKADYDSGVDYDEGLDVGIFSQLFVSMILAALVSLIICMILKRSMKSVAPKLEARDYIVAGGTKITRRQDRFMFRTVDRREIPKHKDDDNHHFGGGTTIDSDGFSGSHGSF